MNETTHPPQETPPPPLPEPQAPPTRSSSDLKNILTGIFIGVLITIAGTFFYSKHLSQITQVLYATTWALFGGIIIVFVLVFGFKKYITRVILGSKAAESGDVIEEAQHVLDILTDQLADKLLKDKSDHVRQRIRDMLPGLANWFIWRPLKNWWWQWILGIFVALGGLTGTVLLMNQNELLQNQNTLIQRQMLLEEANRRSALVVLMSNIMDKVDTEIENQKKRLPESAQDTARFKLSKSLIGQIAALSHSFKPYRYMEGDTLISRPLSPERGQLLITLTQIPLDSPTIRQIYLSSTFESADLKYAILNRANLSGLNLNYADLTHALVIDANLHRTMLRGANLSNANFSNSVLEAVNLDRAKLQRTILFKANLIATSFVDADLFLASLEGGRLWDSNFSGASLKQANLSQADLSGAYFLKDDFYGVSQADLSDTDLSGTILKNISITVKQLSMVYSLHMCEELSDSIKLKLEKTHQHLFIPH